MAGERIIRKLFVALGIEGGKRAAQQLQEVQAQTTRLRDGFQALVRDAAKVAGAITAAATASAYQALETAREAEEIERRSRALQLSTRAYQRHLAVFEQFGADGADIADVLGTLTDRAEDAMEGTASMVEDFALVGLSVDDLRGKRPDELLALFADAVAGASDKNKALTATVRLLGDDLGAKLLPMLQLGSDGMERMQDEAEAMGAVMSSDALEAANALQGSWRQLGLVVKGLRNELGAQFAPVLGDVVDGIKGWVVANRDLVRSGITGWVERLRGPIEAVARSARFLDVLIQRTIGYDGVLRTLVAAGGIGGTLLLMRRLAPIIDATVKGWRALSAAAAVAGVSLGWWVAALAAVGALLAGVYLVLDDFYVTMQGGDSVMLRFIAAWEQSEGVLGSFARLLRVSMRSARAIFTIVRAGAGRLATAVGDAAMAFGEWLLGTEKMQKVVANLERGWGRVKNLVTGIRDAVAGLIDGYATFFESGPLAYLEGLATSLSQPNDLPPIGPQMAAGATSTSTSTTVNNNQSTTTVNSSPTVNVAGTNASPADIADAIELRQAQLAAGGVR